MKAKVCQANEIPSDGMVRFEVEGTAILVANAGDTLFAVSAICSHAEGSLCDGFLDVAECTVECPLHGAVFSLKNGEALEFPAEDPISTYVVTVEGDDLYVELPDA